MGRARRRINQPFGGRPEGRRLPPGGFSVEIFRESTCHPSDQNEIGRGVVQATVGALQHCFQQLSMAA